MRWEVLGVTNVIANFYPEFTGTAGRDLYFANSSNSSSGEQYFQSFDLDTNAFSDEALTGNEFCACGYSGMTVSTPDSLYYFANGGVRFSPGDRAWSAVSGYTGDVEDGENVAVYLDGRIYRVGGREYPGRVSYFDIESDSWTIDGLSSLSEDASQWCGGAADGRLYLFAQGGSTYEYTVASDSWVSLGASAGTPPPCYGLSLHRWGDHLVTATDSNGVALFDLRLLSWEPSRIPFPEDGLLYQALVAGGELYLLGYDNFDDTVTVFAYRL